MSEMIEVKLPAWKLSGIKYCEGEYSPEQWIEKVGVDPRDYPNYFEIRNGRTYSRPVFERHYQVVSTHKRNMMGMLTSY